jgi:alkaline phosphatase
MKLISNLLAILIIATTANSCKNTKVKQKIANKPNVILLIGDGMGLSQLSSAYYFSKSKSNFSRFPEVGLINTSSATHKITDSSAGGTAFSCGQKTYNGSLGMSVDSTIIPNIVEILSKENFNTGIVVTSAVTHATPAAFYAHVKSRSMQNEIALQLIDSDLDFFAGGGSNYFSNRPDSVDLLPRLSEKGFLINKDLKNSSMDSNKKYGFIFAEDGMPSMNENRGDFLPTYTQYAIDYLSNKKEKFFLMIEGSQIDWGGHANDADYVISEVLDFDKTVGVAMDFAMENKNTLVIVLADHETGGFTLASKNDDYSEVEARFSTGGHSTTLIPVLAYGPGSENFKGIYQNNEIFHKILDLTK